MTCDQRLTFCATLILTATVSLSARGQVNTLPPPPTPGQSPASDPATFQVPSQAPAAQAPAAQAPAAQAPAAQAPTQSPTQAPIQAPSKSAPETMTCTIMVPQLTYKTMTVPTTICRPETRQKTVTVSRMIPETTMRTCVETVLVPEQRTTTQTYTACRMTYETVNQQVTVMVPHNETRQGTRTVCRPVAVQQMKTVCREVGGWTTQSYVDCCGCTRTCQVWCSKTVTEQVPVTVYRPEYTEEPYTYTIVTCRPEQRTVTRQIAKPVYETKTRDVTCLVAVAKQVERQVPQTTYRPVTEERVVNYTVMVPHTVERQVQVPVCTLVPKQVTYTVPTCGATTCGMPACGPGRTCGW